MLLNFDHDEIAEKLQNAFGELLNLIERGKNEIWPKLAVSHPLDAVKNIFSFVTIQPENGYFYFSYSIPWVFYLFVYRRGMTSA